MSDSISEYYKNTTKAERHDHFHIKYEIEQKEKAIVKRLERHIIAMLKVGKENAMSREDIDIVLEHFCPIKHESYHVRDACTNIHYRFRGLIQSDMSGLYFTDYETRHQYDDKLKTYLANRKVKGLVNDKSKVNRRTKKKG